MAYRLKFSGRAVREIGEAFDWYEEQSKGLGSEFELALELQLKRLEQVPLLYAEIVPGVRRTLLPRFPYGVFYTVKNDLVHVLAVIHAKAARSFKVRAMAMAGGGKRFGMLPCIDLKAFKPFRPFRPLTHAAPA